MNPGNAPLTLAEVAACPDIVTAVIQLPSGKPALLRPLAPNDTYRLTQFLGSLSQQTRTFYSYTGEDTAVAHEMCTAINRYDKLRLVVTVGDDDRIIALLAFSFDLSEPDQHRFAKYSIDNWKSETTCRFAPCLADDYQNQGVGTILFPYFIKIARRFGQNHIILWGGVLSINARALHYYEKHGFQRLGKFKNQTGQNSYDMLLVLER